MEYDLTLMVCRLDRSLRTCLEHTASPGLRAVADSEGKHPSYGHDVVESCPASRSCTWRALQLCAHLLGVAESALILQSYLGSSAMCSGCPCASLTGCALLAQAWAFSRGLS